MTQSLTNKPARMLKSVFPGKYIQGENALLELPGIIRLFGKNGLVLASHTAKYAILSGYDFGETNVFEVEEFAGECCEEEISRVMRIITVRQIAVLVGMGGGKTIDTAKIAADRANIPVIIVPTIASTDAPCSGCAVVYSSHGVFDHVHYQKLNPQVVLVDTSIIANSPVRFLVAGMGDALATWFEARSCERTKSKNECDGYSTITGLNLARLCYDTLLEYGEAALVANENKAITPALNRIIEANILLSGIGFESSGLAAAHAIHNGLTALDETHAFYHGEKVAFGVLAGLHLTDARPAEMETVYAFCEKIGLPTTLQQIGLSAVTREKLMAVAEKACVPTEAIHHEAGEITPVKVFYAIIAADAMGRKRKNKA